MVSPVLTASYAGAETAIGAGQTIFMALYQLSGSIHVKQFRNALIIRVEVVPVDAFLALA